MASFQVFNWTSSEPIHHLLTLLLIGRHDAWFIFFSPFFAPKRLQKPFLPFLPFGTWLKRASRTRSMVGLTVTCNRFEEIMPNCHHLTFRKIYHPPLLKIEFRWMCVVFLKGREMSKNPKILNDSWQPRNPRRLFQAPTFGLTNPKWARIFRLDSQRVKSMMKTGSKWWILLNFGGRFLKWWMGMIHIWFTNTALGVCFAVVPSVLICGDEKKC